MPLVKALCKLVSDVLTTQAISVHTWLARIPKRLK